LVLVGFCLLATGGVEGFGALTILVFLLGLGADLVFVCFL